MVLLDPGLNNSIPADGLKAKLNTQIIIGRANTPAPTRGETDHVNVGGFGDVRLPASPNTGDDGHA